MYVLSRLVTYLRRYRWLLVLTYICLIGSTLLSLTIPRFLGSAIDTVLGSGNGRHLLFLASLVVAVSLIRGVLTYGQSYLAELIGQRVAYDLRNTFLEKLHGLSFAFHDHQKTGDLMSKATYDVETIHWFVSFGLIRSLNLVIMLLGVAGLLLTMNWKLGLMSLVVVPPTIYLSVKLSRSLRRIWVKVQEDTGRMTTVLQENLSGMRVVKAFGGEEYEKRKFGAVATVVASETFRANRLNAVNSSLLTFLFSLITGLVIWYGGRQVLDATLTPGELTQFILYLGLMVMPVRMIGWIVNIYSRAISSGERIFPVLDTQSAVVERPKAVKLGKLKGVVRFEQVSFNYNSLAPALRNINLEILAGQRVALLGAPGSGKSTVVSLVPRFYDVSDGRVTVDGVDVRDITIESLRRNVGIVFQDVFLFSATIRENIAYAAPRASFEEIIAAAKAAQLHEFIIGLPKGYDTWVGERGVTLSGGQRQRLAVARTLLLDPPVLILDDSTSNVDAETEAHIRKAVAEVMKGRTTLIIAHRVSSVKNANLILVLKDGEIVERGTHDELVVRDGFYRQIYQLQLLPAEETLTGVGAGDGGAG